MDLSRRGFLKILGIAAPAALVLPASLDALPFTEIIHSPTTYDPRALVGLKDIAQELVRLMAKTHRISGYLPAQGDHYRVGDRVQVAGSAREVTITDQWNVACWFRDERALHVDRDIAPMAEVLAEVIRRKKINVFAEPCMVRPGVGDVEECVTVRHNESGLAIRGIQQHVYDPIEDHLYWATRFDILGAAA